ncbi:restriction endonuclease subunit S [Polynucleobacter sp. JS-Safj-400b-B2]|jgi:type I restriction enzyme S subunit|uniref:restriction endonuclease subunit S n=1 Tax=Polynucleobacter sp. JS-Safj-400b-B2 TaxID=2576921 RepID=UPI001C0E5C79|nr:restriction endonuclease subunit S [Polynucleobacter sp. JS-Safj-400b-B2]MBU3626595.1 restriction endonuclease subunit S [Polynucleobacter sp. JS-Safj-400b-B2]
MGYAQYKELDSSGVSWLQKKPSHWRIKRLKFSTDLINNKVSVEDSPLPYLGLEHIESWTGRKIEGEISNSEGLASSFVVGDVLFGKLRPYLAKVYLAQQDGLISSEALVIRSKDELDAEFLKYYMLSRDFINIVDSSTYGSKMPRASWDSIGNLPVLLPDVEEQKVIACFLDFKTAQIDALITKQQTLLDKLAEMRTALISHAVVKGLDPSVSMKDSGVAWLGKIPENWDVWKVTHGFGKIGSGTTPKSDNPIFYDGTIPWVTTSELRESVIFDTMQKVTVEAVASHSALKIYPAGSLAIAMYGATIGRLGILGVEATFNQACCVFSDPMVFDNRFVYYWLWMRRPILISLSNGGGQPNLSQDDLKKIWIPIPGLDEQRTIVRFLDAKTAKVDEQVKKVESVIAKLLEYRSSLITNAVTGKIDVRDFQIPQSAEGLAS